MNKEIFYAYVSWLVCELQKRQLPPPTRIIIGMIEDQTLVHQAREELSLDFVQSYRVASLTTMEGSLLFSLRIHVEGVTGIKVAP